MSKHGMIAFCLFLSLLLNGFLLKMYVDNHSSRIVAEKGITMNEYIEREKELRNFRAFIGQLAAKEDKLYPISKEQASLYWLLAVPEESVIMKPTYEIQADYKRYNDDLEFFQEFDREYKAVVNHFKTKLPLLNKEQLTTFGYRLDETYVSFMDEGLRDWRVSRNGTKVDIRFEPPKAILNQVIQELKLIREELEALK